MVTEHIREMLETSRRICERLDAGDIAPADRAEALSRASNLAGHAAAELDDEYLRLLHGPTDLDKDLLGEPSNWRGSVSR